MSEAKKEKNKIAVIIGRIFATLGVFLALVLFALVGVLFVVFKGPAESTRKIVTLSLNETSALKWIPGLFMSQEKVDAYIAEKNVTGEGTVTNASLIQIAATTSSTTGSANTGDAAEGNVVINEEDPDGDGIIIEEVTGASYHGYMMIVLDPSRVTLGTPDYFGGAGLTIEEMAAKYDAVACINAGGFEDPNGFGEGGTPIGIVISGGEITYGSARSTYTLVGFDKDHRLIVGTMTGQEALDMNMDCCCQFGPSLIINGVPQNEEQSLASGVNPRTAIGQRSDGAVLMLVVDGRQVSSPGATLDDLVQIMMDYGAVNASNLDGGSSSTLWYEGEILNSCASVFGFRKLPTSYVVLPKSE